MFFADKIRSIGPNDRVLEVGPGATPHPRSNAFLELEYLSLEEKRLQRGGGLADGNFGDRPVFHYTGGMFPFGDGEFNYVICSHVIEHVNEPAAFMREVFRVGNGRGYLEYPMITYEYMYGFAVHQHFLKFDHSRGVLQFLPKVATNFHEFAPVHSLFYSSLEKGWDDVCAANKNLFFEGFEFSHAFDVEQTQKIELLCPTAKTMATKGIVRKLIGRIFNKLGI